MNKDKLLKEMKKAVQQVRKKNAIDDVLDPNNRAEMSDKSVPTGAAKVMHKEEKEEDCNCKGESKKDCECEEAAPMDKAEEIVKSIINNFKKICDIYLEKQEKTVSDDHGRYSGPDRRKRSFMTSLKRKSPNNRKIKSKKVIEEKRSKLRRRKSDKLPKNAPDFKKIKQKQAEAKQKQAEAEAEAKAAKLKQMHENIKAAGLPEAPKDLAQAENRCWEGYEPTPGKKAYTEGSCQKKSETGDEPTLHSGKGQVSSDTQKKVKNIININQKLNERKKLREDKKAKRVKEAQQHAENLKQKGIEPKFDPMAASEKPFHGYNKEKHSVKGGLSKKGREKINREEGSNLKAPVSSKAAKKSKKKASRRKSFCARMSGVKGPTSKKGKLTPKGAALKRWDC